MPDRLEATKQTRWDDDDKAYAESQINSKNSHKQYNNGNYKAGFGWGILGFAPALLGSEQNQNKTELVTPTEEPAKIPEKPSPLSGTAFVNDSRV